MPVQFISSRLHVTPPSGRPLSSESTLEAVMHWLSECVGKTTGSSRQLNSLLEKIQKKPSDKALLTQFHGALKLALGTDEKKTALSAENLFKEKLTGASVASATKSMREIYKISFLDRHKTTVTIGAVAALGLAATSLYLYKTSVNQPVPLPISDGNSPIIETTKLVGKAALAVFVLPPSCVIFGSLLIGGALRRLESNKIKEIDKTAEALGTWVESGTESPEIKKNSKLFAAQCILDVLNFKLECLNLSGLAFSTLPPFNDLPVLKSVKFLCLAGNPSLTCLVPPQDFLNKLPNLKTIYVYQEDLETACQLAAEDSRNRFEIKRVIKSDDKVAVTTNNSLMTQDMRQLRRERMEDWVYEKKDRRSVHFYEMRNCDDNSFAMQRIDTFTTHRLTPIKITKR